MLKVIDGGAESNQDGASANVSGSPIDEIVREGARRMLAAALQAEVAAYIDQFAGHVDENGHRLVVRNGYHAERQVLTAAGAVSVKAPRVDDRRVDAETGERQRFSSAILPAWCRRSPQVSEVLPLLYLHGLSTGDFGPALEQFLGSGAGLSAASITRLTASWQDEAKAFAARDLSGTDYVYLWVDGIHTKVRLEQEKLCLLVMLGVRADGRKELVAISDGYRESTESWADLLRDCRRRGMTAPVLAVGDGALGFWRALRDVFPQTREQRCWFHKSANVLASLPKSAHPGAVAAMKEIYNAEDIDRAQIAIKAFDIDYGAKYPKAVAKIVDDADVLLEFYRYPAEHWIHDMSFADVFPPAEPRTGYLLSRGSGPDCFQAGGLVPSSSTPEQVLAGYLRTKAQQVHMDDRTHRLLRELEVRLGHTIVDPDVDVIEQDINTILVAGARVCFTGTCIDEEGNERTRSDMENLAAANRLVPVKTVTKSKCDALITAEAGSQSGKAKTATTYGKPIFTAKQFLVWTLGG